MIGSLNITPSGDSILIINSTNQITLDNLSSIVDKIKSSNIPEIEDIIILKDHIGLIYNPYITSYNECKSKIISSITRNSKKISNKKKRIWKIPICYHTDLANDINDVSKKLNINTKEFIRIHNKSSYMVDMIGFLPGFLYLGGLNNLISLPRKQTPRKIIPKGSIGIANNQTGIYNIESPGGWNIIGRTPCELFDKNSDPPIKIQQGDTINFYEIDINEFNRISNL
ncbi:MAG: 5-oxoprolinase subunit PxpB [Cytophagales bacterium]|nr:5-oxoprolinase subunit PxpB [Cytophagales bacterium]